ncbi:N-6 DNA methylase [Streptomyces turgidiscabies]|uniref:N-6 DNA Methylase n=2 Tax=Streptomyces TaxID=1883 RepID=L7EU01_STRT8|nr:N-6 DNA methylase [Streptomyces turgidiscabies]ELP62364.1 N-6 DNA Methylase [Streptomyces turgidiscabies Car8]MDX3493454.1 N-6 DNA methylase [Streptomyces turgidiscabies]
MQDNATEVTAAGIARLAGVGRAAVSNWRRRHADFPKPVGGTETSPAFALAEVESWLRHQGKLAEVPLRERVWQQLVGHPEGPATALVHAGCVLLLIHDRPTVWLELGAVSDERLAARLPATLEQVIAPRFGVPQKRGVHTSPTARAVHTASAAQGVHSPTGVRGVHSPTVAGAESAVNEPGGVNTSGAVNTPPGVHASHPAPGVHTTPAPPRVHSAASVHTAPTAPSVHTQPAVHTPTGPALLPSVPLLRGVAELAAEMGARQTYEFLVGRHLDANPRQYTLTPAELARLMGDLAGPARTVLDPACGTGALLRALPVRGTREIERDDSERELYGQDSAPELAALTALRLALQGRSVVRTAVGDTLRSDAYPGLRADVVLCHPPFNERNWGHDELAYDARWEYGFPARNESELAWVQHALARLRDGGTAVLLMPPAAASRRSGRRIRADLLRRGALRAVIALPVGAAPPYNIPLHLWVLRRPDKAPAQPEVLLADIGSVAEHTGRGGLDWEAVRAAVLDAWRPFERAGTAAERPGVARSVPVIELLDDDVDLAPARHLPPATAGDGEHLSDVRDRLGETLRLTADLTPPAPAGPSDEQPGRWPLITIGELARGGALVMRTGGNGGHARVPVLTDQDVLAGTAPSGSLPESDEEAVRVEAGDVVVPVLGGGSVARVVDDVTAGAVLGRSLVLLRPDPAALDPWFLAGFLRGTANNRQASSYASTATRLDVRRLQLPRLPLDEQRRYGARFRSLAEFEEALRHAGRLGGQLVRGMYDGLTDGTVAPD